MGAAAEIVFDRVTKRYPGRATAAVDSLSLRIPAGEICVLVGPSGAGKTTAMKMVNRLIEIDGGDIIGSIPVTTLIDQRKVTGGDIFSTEPVLSNRKKYVILDDTKNIFGFQNVAPVVSKRLVAQLGPTFAATVNAVSKNLSLNAVISMNKAVGIAKKSPAAVALAFLKANKLA